MSLSSILPVLIMIFLFISIGLGVLYFYLDIKEKKEKSSKKNNNNKSDVEEKVKVAKSYTKESIFKFMEFDKIQDSMIIQKGGKKFLMVLECQGINYDLMSEMEKTAVESGFIQFLNTLRAPIQIYIQTRTVNLEDSLKRYKEKLKKVENELIAKDNKLRAMQEAGTYTEEQMRKQYLEIRRQKNLFDYGRDIIFNTERMSMNKNVLRKKYYIIVSYYLNETDSENYLESEILETAFSDLYTKCQSIIRTLGISGVNGKVLDSYELIDLLYNAYNREEAENYGVERAQKAEFDSLYTTSPDVLEKKMKAIDRTIEEKALELAEDSVRYAKKELEKEIKEKEESMDFLIEELANQLIDENEQYLTPEVTEKAKKNIRKKQTKEEANNGKK